MSTNQEVEYIGPGFRRQGDSIHRGFWTPELAEWREDNGYREIRDLQYFIWTTGVKYTGAVVNASPVLCVTKTQAGHVDLNVNITYSVGIPDPDQNVTSGDTVISGYTIDYQYNEAIYRRAWVTGGITGLFNATNNFKDEADGTSDTDIDYVDTISAGTVEIIEEYQGHKKVLHYTTEIAANFEHIFDENHVSGTIEFYSKAIVAREYWMLNSSDPLSMIYILVYPTSARFYYGDGGGGSTYTQHNYVNNTFPHFKIEFDCTTDTYSGWCEDVLVVEDVPFIDDNVVDNANAIRHYNAAGFEFYYDAEGYSWDPDYEIGDNLTQGLNPISYQFTIPAHTKPGQVYRLPNKRIYKINDITVSGAIADQPLTRLGFYALADNGSKLLYSMNWNKVFEYGRTVLYGTYGNPSKCPRCSGSGYIGVTGNTCQQCDGYKYNGPNASGFLQNQVALDYGLIKDPSRTDEDFRNKVWAMNWWVTPTKKEIQRYFAHFARIESEEIEVTNIDRVFTSNLPTGVEKAVDVLLPYTIPFSVFDKSDRIWDNMAESIEPAGIDIRFSFLIAGFSGAFEWDEWDTPFVSGIVTGAITGLQPEYVVYGADAGIWNMDHGSNSFYSEWGEDFFFFNHLCESIHKSGYISGASGIQLNSGAAHSWESGAIESGAWLKWVEVSGSAGKANIWNTGDGVMGLDQDLLWSSGTYYWDNFWSTGSSGATSSGIQY